MTVIGSSQSQRSTRHVATRQTRVLCAVANSVATLCQRMSRLLRAEDGFAACADFNRLLLHRRLRGTNFLTSKLPAGLLFLADNFFQACVNKIAKTNNAEFRCVPFHFFSAHSFRAAENKWRGTKLLCLLRSAITLKRCSRSCSLFSLIGFLEHHLIRLNPIFQQCLSRLAFCG